MLRINSSEMKDTLGQYQVLYFSALHFHKCSMFSYVWKLFITSYMVNIKELEILFTSISPKASFAGWLWACCFHHLLATCKSEWTQTISIFLLHCSRLSHMIFESLPWFQCTLISKVISCTITCSVLFLNSSWMNLTSCPEDFLQGVSFRHTQKTLVTSDLLCKDSVGILS